MLASKLAPGVVVADHQEASYAHMDFTWGENAHTLIYPHMISLLRKYA